MILSKGLSGAVRTQIKALEKVCSETEPLCMKLNWDMLEMRLENEVNDLLWYEDGCLVGYLGLYCIGGNTEEIEMTGMVHPEYRRRGIFSKLFSEAVAISRDRSAGRILLIAERQSLSGARFAEKEGLTYRFSEYRLSCDSFQVIQDSIAGFSLRPAVITDIAFLNHLDETCFGSAFPGSYDERLHFVEVAAFNGRDIGKIGLDYEAGLGYIFGVCILPEFRDRGYGRAMFTEILKKHFTDHSTPVILEVAVTNDNALSLYKSCGFNERTIYDYFELTL